MIRTIASNFISNDKTGIIIRSSIDPQFININPKSQCVLDCTEKCLFNWLRLKTFGF